MLVYPIQSEVILLAHKHYGARLLFGQGETNPRNELGKNGVTVHNKFTSLFYKTITIEARSINKKGEHAKKLFIINRNSLIKYIGSKASAQDSDEVLIQKLDEKMYGSSLNQPNEEDRLKQIEASLIPSNFLIKNQC